MMTNFDSFNHSVLVVSSVQLDEQQSTLHTNRLYSQTTRVLNWKLQNLHTCDFQVDEHTSNNVSFSYLTQQT